MNCQLEYKLKQQTPLIHFQHDQSGATLRATEVKPKLDKFIIKKMGGEEKVPKEWFIKDTKALNYKMRIIADGKPERSQTIDLTLEIKKERDRDRRKQLNKQLQNQINGMYFGNMVSNRDRNYEEAVRDTYKETVFYREPIQLNIICFIEGLRNIIESNIDEFFIITNFGTRQSKGFGGFVVDRKDKKDPIELLSKQEYRFFYAEVAGDVSQKAMLNHAKNVYSVMKGGYNHTKFASPESYIKGYIQRYFIDDFFDEKVGGDKAFIKKFKKKNIKEEKCDKYEEFIFTRALLGLADYYEFRDEVRSGRVEIFSLGENSFDVERFNSPITIKIIGDKLIFLFGSFDEICGKTFYFAPNPENLDPKFNEFSYEKKKKYILDNEHKKDKLGNMMFVSIPTIDKFDDEDIMLFINAFAEYFMEERYKFGTFRDESIRISRNLKIIVPKYLERSF